MSVDGLGSRTYASMSKLLREIIDAYFDASSSTPLATPAATAAAAAAPIIASSNHAELTTSARLGMESGWR